MKIHQRHIIYLIAIFACVSIVTAFTHKTHLHMLAGALIFMTAVLLTAYHWYASHSAKAQDHKKLRTDAEESEKRFRTLFNEMLSGFALHEIICDEQGTPVDYRFLMINPAFEKIIGTQADKIIGKTLKEVMPDADPIWVETYGKVALTGQPVFFEKYTQEIDKFVAISAYSPAKGQFACVIQDVTDRKKAEAALIESKKRYVQISQQSRTFTWETNMEGVYTYIGPVAESIIGYTPEEVVGKKSFYDIAPKNDRETLKQQGMGFISAGKAFKDYENRILTKSGEIIWVSTSGMPLYDNEGNLTGLRGYDTDITSRKAAETSMEQLAACVEQASDSIVITSKDGTIEYVNPAFTSITGYSREEALGSNPRILKSGTHDPTMYQEMWRVLDLGKVWRGRLVNKKKNGTLYTQETSISPIRSESGNVVSYIAVTHDITETLSLQEQLLQSQKMESIGRLAGGIAHDFNNMLMGIMGYADMARDKLPADHPAKNDMDAILNAVNRTATLTRQLLTFARKQTIQPVVLDLNVSIPSTMKFLKRLIGESVQLKWAPKEDIGHVKMDPGQLDQILANLCVNARDALITKDNATITISTGNIHITSEDCRTAEDASPGDYVYCAVRDNGSGIPGAIQQQIFDPFFTTKGVGEGTGLGLSTVYGILKQNKGFIALESKENVGTVFTLYFPRITAVPQPESIQEPKTPTVSGDGLTILLVEDEKSIRTIATQYLENMSFSVLAASDPNIAIELAQKHKGKIDLILTDMMMPGMNGKSMVARILDGNTDTKVIYMSGYASDLIKEQQKEENIYFLPKPFSRIDLTIKLAEVLKE